MKIQIEFGLNGFKEQVTWWKNITEFPDIIDYRGSKWQWIMYNKDSTKTVDYICTYSEISSYDPNYFATGTKFEDLASDTYGKKCECGSIYSSFSWDHFRYCPKWKPWSSL